MEDVIISMLYLLLVIRILKGVLSFGRKREGGREGGREGERKRREEGRR